METAKVILKFCNAAKFYDYKNVRITEELIQVRKFIINSFFKTIPDSRIRVSLSIIDDIILKIHGNEIENIIENIHDPRENIFYMLSSDKLINDEQQTVKTEFVEIDDTE